MTDSTEPLGEERPVDPITQLRDIPQRYREALTPQDGSEATSSRRRSPAPEAVEEAAHTRDLLDAAARRVQRLVEDTKPLPDPGSNTPPKRGPPDLDAEVVLDVLDANAERLAQLVEGVPDEAADRAPGVQEGLRSISGELVSEAVTESERRLRDTQRKLEEEH